MKALAGQMYHALILFYFIAQETTSLHELCRRTLYLNQTPKSQHKVLINKTTAILYYSNSVQDQLLTFNLALVQQILSTPVLSF